ncbi:MAG: N-formylglutamate amidohydrolase [Pseudomonadota bacterium]
MFQAEALPFFVSIPHSGEQIPDEVTWLKNLPEPTLMRDVDRYVDVLYQPALNELKITSIVTSWHRYVVDLNRKPDQFDGAAVEGALLPAGTEPKGLHWSVTR